MHVQTPIGVLVYEMPPQEATNLADALYAMVARVKEEIERREKAVPDDVAILPGVTREKR